MAYNYYDPKLKKRIVRDKIENGIPYRELSEKYRVPYQRICTWVNLYLKNPERIEWDRRGKGDFSSDKYSEKETEIQKLLLEATRLEKKA